MGTVWGSFYAACFSAAALVLAAAAGAFLPHSWAWLYLAVANLALALFSALLASYAARDDSSPDAVDPGVEALMLGLATLAPLGVHTLKVFLDAGDATIAGESMASQIISYFSASDAIANESYRRTLIACCIGATGVAIATAHLVRVRRSLTCVNFMALLLLIGSNVLLLPWLDEPSPPTTLSGALCPIAYTVFVALTYTLAVRRVRLLAADLRKSRSSIDTSLPAVAFGVLAACVTVFLVVYGGTVALEAMTVHTSSRVGQAIAYGRDVASGSIVAVLGACMCTALYVRVRWKCSILPWLPTRWPWEELFGKVGVTLRDALSRLGAIVVELAVAAVGFPWSRTFQFSTRLFAGWLVLLVAGSTFRVPPPTDLEQEGVIAGGGAGPATPLTGSLEVSEATLLCVPTRWEYAATDSVGGANVASCSILSARDATPDYIFTIGSASAPDNNEQGPQRAQSRGETLARAIQSQNPSARVMVIDRGIAHPRVQSEAGLGPPTQVFIGNASPSPAAVDRGIVARDLSNFLRRRPDADHYLECALYDFVAGHLSNRTDLDCEPDQRAPE